MHPCSSLPPAPVYADDLVIPTLTVPSILHHLPNHFSSVLSPHAGCSIPRYCVKGPRPPGCVQPKMCSKNKSLSLFVTRNFLNNSVFIQGTPFSEDLKKNRAGIRFAAREHPWRQRWLDQWRCGRFCWVPGPSRAPCTTRAAGPPGPRLLTAWCALSRRVVPGPNEICYNSPSLGVPSAHIPYIHCSPFDPSPVLGNNGRRFPRPAGSDGAHTRRRRAIHPRKRRVSGSFIF